MKAYFIEIMLILVLAGVITIANLIILAGPWLGFLLGSREFFIAIFIEKYQEAVLASAIYAIFSIPIKNWIKIGKK